MIEATVLTKTEPEIDWGYEWRIVRWRRISISRAAKWRFGISISWCFPCQRMVFSFSIAKIYGSINCQDTRTLVPPPAIKSEWPELVYENILDAEEIEQMIRRPLHRSDANQERIIKALRSVGIKVEIIGEPVDVMTLYSGVVRLIEIKNSEKSPSGKKLRPSQQKFMAEWAGGPVYKVETIGEALAVHGIRVQ